MKKSILFLTILSVFCVNIATATIKTYPALAGNLYKSSRYNVSVTQSGNTESSYVYNSVNTYTDQWGSQNLMTLDNNFTNFSFDGSVVVTVTLPLRTTAITSVEILPSIKGVTATWNGYTITISIGTPGNYYVRINGEERNPLFIFANPLEINPPASSGDPNVEYLTPANFTANFSSTKAIWYFAPGVYAAGSSGGTLQNIPSGKTVYLAGGAYLKALLKASASATNLTVRGRGILSGIDVANEPGLWGNHMVDGFTATTLTMEGIIMTDAPSQFVQSYASGSTYDNLKLLGWYAMTDGITDGINSTIKNCFLKINDDGLKPMRSNSIYRDNVVWIQAIGSSIQLGWNIKAADNPTNIMVDGVDIIGCDVANLTGTANNVSVVSLQNIDGATYSGITIQNIRSDVKVYKVFELQIKSTLPGYTTGTGTVNGITFKNFNIPFGQQYKSTFNGNGTQTGEIKNVTFENVKIGGTLLTESNATTYLTRSGLTSNFFYTSGDTQPPTIPTGLASSNVTSNSFTLSWTASTDNVGVTGYDVYKDGVLFGSSASTSLNITGLTANTTYAMTVRAKDAAGNVSAASTALSVTTSSASAGSFKIMPLGDSKTEGGGGGGHHSWRGYLRAKLVADGKTINYVGPRANTANGDATPNDNDHAGFGGYTIGPDSQTFCAGCETTGIYEHIQDYFVAQNPDVVLVAIGVNDFFNAANHPANYSATAPQRYQDLVNKILQLKPTATVVLGTVEPVKWDQAWGGNPSDGALGALNQKIKDIANASTTDKIYLADIRAKFLLSWSATDYYDDVHLNQQGATKVANAWYDALVPILSGTTPPADTQAPTAPTSLISSNVTSTGFTVSWTASTDNVGVTGYNVYKDGILYGSSASTSLNITGLAGNTTYAITVKATDAAGNVSAASTALIVTTLASGSTNLLQNPGFESGVLSPWVNWGTAFNVSNDGNAHAGSWSGKCNPNTGGAQNVAATAGVTYTLSAYGKVSGTQYGAVGYYIMNSAGTKIVNDTYMAQFSTVYSMKSISFTAPAGTATIGVILWNTDGGTMYVDDFSLTSNNTPTATSNSPVCAGSTINLSTPAVTGATYSWTGPNGFTSALQNPSIANATTAMSGTYSVTVTVSGNPSSPGTTTVVVNPIPATPVASSNSPVCTGTAINLTTATVTGATYSWTGPNGFTSAVQNPAIASATAAMAGTYSVTVTTNGCTSTAGTTTVVVNTTPATPSAGSNSPVCTGATINLSTAAVTGATYSWTGPNGFTSAAQNPAIANATAAMAGTYSVMVTTNGCTSAAGTTSVVVNTIPSTPAASSNSPVTVGATINLSTAAVTGATYSWTGPNGFTSASQNPAIANATTAMAGTYSVTVTTNGCASAAGTTSVVVNATSSNLALNRPVTASSVVSPYVAANAVDGNGSSFWASAYTNNEWIYVDLGASYNVNRVKITWETAYATAYQIQISSDASTWTTLKTITGNTSLVNDHTTGIAGTGRYIRMLGTTRATQWGYSIYELEVYGTLFTDTQAPTIPTGLASSSVTSNSFTLNWTASTDNVGVTGYDVHKDGVLYGSSASTSLNITGLTANTTYAMTVRAKDAAGNVSAASTALNVTTSSSNNLLLNPGFESGVLSPWVNWGTAFNVSNDGNAHAGSWSGKCNPDAGGVQYVSATAGVTYTLSAYGKITGTEYGAVGYHIMNSAGAKIVNDTYMAPFSTVYGMKSISFTAPAGTASIGVIMWNVTGGTMYVDDFSLTSVASASGRSANQPPKQEETTSQEPKFRVFPNPVANILTVNGESSFDILIFDTHGRIVNKVKAVNAQTEIDMSSFSSGLYFIKVQSLNKSYIKKVIKQ